MRTHRLMPGSVFAGAYQVEGLIGQGAMGMVYRTRDLKTGTTVAVKLMNAQLAAEPEFGERFVQEAAIGRLIPSEGVIKVLDAGVDEASKLPWMAMEFLDGCDLGRFLAAHPSLPLVDRYHLITQLFEALTAAHEQSIVHRDLKPENLFVVEVEGQAPRLKVLDFGVAKVVRDATLGGTTPGLGGPMWAAPEQAKHGQRIRARSDVWSLGLVTFWFLTDRFFWLHANDDKASQVDLAKEIIRAEIPPASRRAAELGVADHLPDGFDAWFARSVCREPEGRFLDAGEAYRSLAPLFATRARPDRTPKRGLGYVIAALVLVILLGIAAARLL